MRIALFGLIVIGVLGTVWFASAGGELARAQQARQPLPPAVSARPATAAAGDWMAFCSDSGNGPTQITLIDAKAQVMSVYHINRTTGEIELKSVRKVEWDLRMEEFNSVRPLPKEIRALLEQR